MLSTLAIILSLALLMYFAYRGYSVLILAPLMAILAVTLSGDFLVSLPLYTTVFMKALSGFLLKFFPIFLLGALFGQLMADSGAATAIARTVVNKLGSDKAILAVVLVCSILTYGGVSLFVVAFAIYPIAKDLFKAAQVPKRLIPGAIALGSFTYTMTSLPGTPAIQNAIPIPYYGTNAFAAPILSIIGSLVMFGLGMLWLRRSAAKAKLAGEGYGIHADDDIHADKLDTHNVSFAVAMIPLILVIAINALLTYVVFPSIDFTALTAKFPELDIKGSLGLWSIIIALITAIITLLVLTVGKWHNLQDSINKGTYSSMLPIFNTGSEVGYGAVIATLAGFAVLRDSVLNLAPNNPLISEAVAMTTLAGITGSSSGGLSIALPILGKEYLARAVAAGIDPELLHRVAVMAAGGLDSLPHCGAVITLLSICHLTHRQSYKDIAVITMAIPLVAVALVIMLGTMFGSF
jgi:H+/gluconate symporter-like permease